MYWVDCRTRGDGSKRHNATKPVLVPETKLNEEDIDNDYKYQREYFYNLIERGQDAINGILDLEESEHPRTYEVVGT